MASIISAGTTSGTALNMAGDTSGVLQLATNGSTTAITIDASQNVGIGTASPSLKFHVVGPSGDYRTALFETASSNGPSVQIKGSRIYELRSTDTGAGEGGGLFFIYDKTAETSRVAVNSSGAVMIGKTAITFGTQGAVLNAEGAFYNTFTRSGGPSIVVNRITNDGTLIEFAQDGTTEGTISVSGTTVSYNGGHLSRWSQLYNETEKINVYRGTVLESVDAMCVWEKDGEPLPNEQATKTIVSTTVASKAVAGVFDRYDEDDETNPYDFYVAQSGDFVIRIAEGVTVQNGDLLESAGDGTARPQTDDICRSSTIAKVTSNYVSVTYEDGSYCVPCILMIG